jgi:cobaltochelatase CobT
VIRHIDTRSPVELLEIGIGHNVGAYYPRSFTVTGAENLGEALVTQLIALLDAPRRRGAAVRRPARASASAVR